MSSWYYFLVGNTIRITRIICITLLHELYAFTVNVYKLYQSYNTWRILKVKVLTCSKQKKKHPIPKRRYEITRIEKNKMYQSNMELKKQHETHILLVMLCYIEN